MSEARIRVLFVCLGNICRSPLAEAVFRALIGEAELGDRFEIGSAGTSGYHEGDRPDPRTLDVARRRGVRLDGVARKVSAADFDHFDYVLAMDEENHRVLSRLAGQAGGRAELRRLREFDPESGGRLDVPDPYYGGPRGFEDVHDIIERSCHALLEHLRTSHGL